MSVQERTALEQAERLERQAKELSRASAVLAKEAADRERAERAHQKSEEQVRLQAAALEAAANAIVVTDGRGMIQWVNPAFTQITGYRPEEVLGKNPRMLKSGKTDPSFYEALWKTILSGKVWAGEITNRKKDGQLYVEEMTIAPLCSGAGEITNFVAIKQDITRRKEAEEELVKAKAAAEVASHAKGEFLANMSHEIRTPMNGIIGMTDLLLETDLTPEQNEYLAMVKGSADSLLTIINDILDFSKIEAGKLELESISFDLRKSLSEMMKTLALRAGQKGIEFIFDVHPDLPQQVRGDPTRLRQILLNLVGNALKFTDRGEISVRARVDQKIREGCSVHFSVSDTGIGIPAEKQKMIFEAFSQADASTTRDYGGTGLGLTISSRLVGLMRGTIWVESRVAVGSTFHFTVPFEPVEQVPTARFNRDDLAGVRILIVDDNATNRHLLENSVAEWGMIATSAASAAVCLEFLRRLQASGQRLPILLTDSHMPEMDGFGLIEAIRQDPGLAGIKIVVLTSGGRRGEGARCRQLGVSAYLTKPIDRLELQEALLRVNFASSANGRTPALITRHVIREQAKPLRLLIAEDNVVNQRLIVRLMEKRGHTVVLAQNGKEALEVLEQQPFDIVLMDGQMPEMDGFEATRRIREKEKVTGAHVPIIALTAHAMQGDKERFLAGGMDGYVAKPLKPEELFAVIEKVVPDLA